jgi:hypothetical protein
VAGTSLLALIDDIATILDDVALLTKVAAKKTAGVMGDDLALNVEQVAGVDPDRELPVVWAVAKGSVKNKLILVPAALAISAVAPWVVTPLLMLGGGFLCYEGFEKVAKKWLFKPEEEEAEHDQLLKALADPGVDMVEMEKAKVRGAVRTDFILSAEIVVIALGAVADASLAMRVAVLCAVAAVMTVGVYGAVAGIVKLDNAALALRRRSSRAARALGAAILRGAPYLMRFLSIAGTAAMFLVGGGILVHGIPGVEEEVKEVAGESKLLSWLLPNLLSAVAGMVAGAAAVSAVAGAKRLRPRRVHE